MTSKSVGESASYTALGPSQYHWQPGWKHLPWKGLGALVLALAGVIVAVAIVRAAALHGQERTRGLKPLRLMQALMTLQLLAADGDDAYALFEGLTVAWWNKAVKDGTSLGDLHRLWAFGNNFMSAVRAGRHFNLIALASILVAVAPINGPLLQRASTTRNGTVSSQQDLHVPVKQLISRGFTGIVSSRANLISMLTTEFAPIAQGYYNKGPISLQTDCVGTCKANILGAGFHANCSSYQLPFNVSASEDTLSSEIFGAEVVYEVYDNQVTATLNVVYKPEPGCVGELLVSNCTLSGGTVEYPIVITGSSHAVALDPESTIWDDVVVGNPDSLAGEAETQGTTTYGGIFLALANQYNTNLVLQFGGGIGWEFWGTQSAASLAYAQNVGDYPSCNITFTNPLPDFLQGARELIFRTAVLSANISDVQSVQAQAFGDHTVYHTEYLFMALATVASLLAILAVLFTFKGFWNIGRVVSLSPIETAKAFNAPALSKADPNAHATALVKYVGDIPIKYGLVHDARDGAASTTSTEASLYRDSPLLSPPRNVMSSNMLRRHPLYRNISDTEFELISTEESTAFANAHLELADPARVTPLP